jgi:CRP-like cAMP-binding protein
MGTREHIEADTCLVEHDRMLARLSVIVSGKADVRLDGEKVAELGEGQLVGQIAYITGEKAPVSIVAKGSLRIIFWARVKLETFFKDRPDVEPQLGHGLGADLTRLLKSAWQSPR